MPRYVDMDDLAYLMTLIRDGFVMKEDGKVLSSNDFTDNYKQMLDKIGEGGLIVNGDKAFVYKQATAASTWLITHGLNKFPSVSIVDSAGSLVVGDVSYIDENNIVVKFSSAFSGKAYIN